MRRPGTWPSRVRDLRRPNREGCTSAQGTGVCAKLLSPLPPSPLYLPRIPSLRFLLKYPLYLPTAAPSRPSSATATPFMAISSSTTLPVLALPHPLILLPTARITLPVQRATGDALLQLVQQSDTQPLVAAVPLSSPDASLNSWGTVARIVRLIRPPARNPKQPFLLSLLGVARVRIPAEDGAELAGHDGVLERGVEYPEPEGTPSMESVVKFKAASLKLLDVLAKETSQQAKRDTYRKVADMLEDTADEKTPWMADVLVASVNGEYADKLGAYLLIFCGTFSSVAASRMPPPNRGFLPLLECPPWPRNDFWPSI